MLRTRLLVGSVLAAVAVGVLMADQSQWPLYPGLLGITLVLAVLATRELIALLPTAHRPSGILSLIGVIGVLGTNWVQALYANISKLGDMSPEAWGPVAVTFAGFVVVASLIEIATFSGAGGSAGRSALAVWVAAYLGLLPCFLVKLRWLPEERAGVALLLAIFVPKCGDIGAYFTGRLVGRHPMAPRLSPKKTWEGFVGGTAFAVATAVGLGRCAPVFRHGDAEAVLFGLLVGWAGVLGDLAESMIKRDAQAKDASANVPGFGGVLDVIDSVIFAAPVAYLFLAR